MNDAKFAQVRAGLAPKVQEAQLRHVDGRPLTPWLTSPEALDAALAQVLQSHNRDQIVLHYEGRVD